MGLARSVAFPRMTNAIWNSRKNSICRLSLLFSQQEMNRRWDSPAKALQSIHQLSMAWPALKQKEKSLHGWRNGDRGSAPSTTNYTTGIFACGRSDERH